MYYGPESLKSEGMLAVEITENDRQQIAALTSLPKHGELEQIQGEASLPTYL